MHPPWIIFHLFLHMLLFICSVSGDAGKNNGNSTASTSQRQIHERERRLIPYMTYYISQSPTSVNAGTGGNIFIPIPSSSENVFHPDRISKISSPHIHNINKQRIEVLPKPAVRLLHPSLFAPAIQVGHYKTTEEDRVLSHVYRLGATVPRIQTPVQSSQQIRSEHRPLQIIKVNPVPEGQNEEPPQFIEVVPVQTKVLLNDRAPKSSTPSHLSYSEGKVKTYTAESVPSGQENSFSDKKTYIGPVPQRYPQFRLVGPIPTLPQSDRNAYTIAKIGFVTTTPLSLINVNEGKSPKIESNINQGSMSQLDQALVKYKGEPVPTTQPKFAGGNYVSITPGLTKVYHTEKELGGVNDESEASIQITKQRTRLRVPQEEKIRFVASVTPIPIANDLESIKWKVSQDNENAEKIYDQTPLSNIFSLLKETNKLPPNLTPENIDAGIQTLAFILERLQQQTNHQYGHRIPVQVSSGTGPSTAPPTSDRQNPKKVHSFPEKSGTSTPGRPGIDYPIYASIPQTNFDCSTQRYKGFFGDPDTKCQVWHYCDLNGGQASFLCPNGTIFSQVALTCDWWFNVKCASTSQLYVLNERLYKYILPFSPSFPEDYSGPVVDTYLAAKFKEMEVKSKLKTLKSQTNATSTAKPGSTTEDPTELIEEYKTPPTAEQQSP